MDIGQLFLAIYVDDLIFASSNDAILNHVMGKLKTHFEITGSDGPLEWVLGTHITQSDDYHTITMDQELFINDTLKIFNISDDRQRCVPAEPNLVDLGDLAEGEMIDPRYRSLIGKLLWLAILTRPDIAYAVSYLARFNNAGGEKHMEAAYSVLRYLARTRTYKLTY